MGQGLPFSDMLMNAFLGPITVGSRTLHRHFERVTLHTLLLRTLRIFGASFECSGVLISQQIVSCVLPSTEFQQCFRQRGT